MLGGCSVSTALQVTACAYAVREEVKWEDCGELSLECRGEPTCAATVLYVNWGSNRVLVYERLCLFVEGTTKAEVMTTQ